MRSIVMFMYFRYSDHVTRHPFGQSWRATEHQISMITVASVVADTYLGVQEVNRDSQKEDEHEQGEQLARRVSG